MREITDNEINRYLEYEKQKGRDNTPSYLIIQSLVKERDFHFVNECEADIECIDLQIECENLLKRINSLTEQLTFR